MFLFDAPTWACHLHFKFVLVLTDAPKLNCSPSTKLLGRCKQNTFEVVTCSPLLYPSTCPISPNGGEADAEQNPKSVVARQPWQAFLFSPGKQRGREGCSSALASSVATVCGEAVAAGAVAGIWNRLRLGNRSRPSLLAWQAAREGGLFVSAGKQCGDCLRRGSGGRRRRWNLESVAARQP